MSNRNKNVFERVQHIDKYCWVVIHKTSKGKFVRFLEFLDDFKKQLFEKVDMYYDFYTFNINIMFQNLRVVLNNHKIYRPKVTEIIESLVNLDHQVY